MRYTVVWHPDAEAELLRIWLSVPDRQAVTDAANAIDAELSFDAHRAGESRPNGRRILTHLPLVVVFEAFPVDRVVRVLSVWHVPKRRRNSEA